MRGEQKRNIILLCWEPRIFILLPLLYLSLNIRLFEDMKPLGSLALLRAGWMSFKVRGRSLVQFLGYGVLRSSESNLIYPSIFVHYTLKYVPCSSQTRKSGENVATSTKTVGRIIENCRAF